MAPAAPQTIIEPPENAIYARLKQARLERYFSLLFAEKKRRLPLMAVAALECALDQISQQVSEPLLGAIRLQFWQEGLQTIRAGKPADGSPLLQAIGAVLAQSESTTYEKCLDDVFATYRGWAFVSVASFDEAYAQSCHLHEAMSALFLQVMGEERPDRNNFEALVQSRVLLSLLRENLQPPKTGLAAQWTLSPAEVANLCAHIERQWDRLKSVLQAAPVRWMPLMADLSHMSPWRKRAVALADFELGRPKPSLMTGSPKSSLMISPTRVFWSVLRGRL